MYNALITEDKLIKPVQLKLNKHVYHLYVLRVPNRDALQKHLVTNNINTSIHYPLPVFAHDAYKDLNIDSKNFPVTVKYSKEILSLPMFPELTEREVQHVSHCINEFYIK